MYRYFDKINKNYCVTLGIHKSVHESDDYILINVLKV